MPKALAASLLLYFAATIPGIDFAALDLRMLQTFSLDEAAFATQVRKMVDTGSLAVDGFTYGALYPYLGYFLSSIYGIFASVTDTAIIVILRLTSVVAAIGTAVYVYRTAHRVSGQNISEWTPALLLSTPLIFKWTLQIHPDLLQLFFITASLYHITAVARELDLREVILGALFAGLAMGTKYSGTFLIPTIGLSILLGAPVGLKESFRHRRVWTFGLTAAIAFAAAFFLSNPYVISNFDQFLQDVSFTRRIVADTEGSGFTWIRMWFSPQVGIVFGLGILATLSVLSNRRWLVNGSLTCLIFFTWTYLGFLLSTINFIADQYLLPIVPSLAVLAAAAIPRVADRIHVKLGASGLACVIVLIQVGYTTPVFSDRTRAESNNPVIEAGLWLSNNYKPDTAILYDTYAYIPPHFTLAETYFGLSYPVIQTHKPDLVVTRKSVRERYRDPNQSDHFRLTEDTAEQADYLYLSPQRYRDIHYTYGYLETDRTGYRLTKDFGTVTVYERREKKEKTNKREEWARIAAAQAGTGVEPELAAGAYRTFGDIHYAAGNWQEAKTQYARSISLADTDILVRYNFATALAHQDSFDAAEAQIDQLGQLVSQPADVWLKFGWDSYQMGAFEKSRQASRKAHQLAPANPLPLYNVALTYLSERKWKEAAAAYAEAAKMHPLPSETRQLLEQMMSHPELESEGKWVIERVIERRNR
jgi:tetratricopeptide (TPR) repeat protein